MPGGASLTLAIDMGSVGTSALVLLFIGASVLLILAILIQKPQGGGLATAFGAGAGSGQTAFGARTGDALTVMTIILFALYLMVGIGLVWVTNPAAPDAAATLTAPGGESEQPAAPAAPGSTAPSGAAPTTGAPATSPAATGTTTPASPAPAAATGAPTTPATPAPATPATPAPATGGPGR